MGELVGERAGRSISFEHIDADYDSTRGGEERGTLHAGLIAPLLDPGRPLLEVGVGTGAVAVALQRAGFRLHGIDLSLAMLRRARARLGPVVVNGDAARLPLRDASVPQACSVWLLHLVGDMVAVAGEVGRVLEPGGRWVVVPAGGEPEGDLDPINRLTLPMLRALHGDEAPSTRPSVDRLRSVAAQSGLEVAEVVTSPPVSYPRESPLTAADHLERRVFSMLWDLDEATFERVVRKVIDALRALPEAATPIQQGAWRTAMVVLRRPR